MSDLERALLTTLKQKGLPLPVAQYQAIPGRRFRFDFAYVDQKLLIEVDGGTWLRNGGGRHNRGTGFVNDCEKASLAAAFGWRLIKVTDKHINDYRAAEWIAQALEAA